MANASVTPSQLLGRSALPLIMLAVLLGTPFWGGYVTLALALILWRSAGILL